MMGIIRSARIHDLFSNLYLTKNLELKLIQKLHTSSSFYAVDKVLLSKLRKKTGFSLSHCKNALDANENDLEKAEKWLIEEAQAHGWAKASKLSGRSTSQGLIGVHIENNIAGLVEVNCETDFVARNNDFRELVNRVTKAFTISPSSLSGTSEIITKEFIDKETIGKIESADEGKSLADLVALTIGKVGENIQLSRGVRFKADSTLDLVGYTHPPAENSFGLAGKYAAVVAFKNASDDQLKREICAHVLGMNPKEIGTMDESESSSDSSSSSEESTSSSSSEKSSSSSSDEGSNEESNEVEEEKEKMLLRQKFMSDQDLTVGEVLLESNIEVIDFIRLECGETHKDD